MKLNLTEWMKNIDDDKNLFSLTIPGTHDCVTKHVQLSHWAKCQDESVFDQLCMGVRALDIRAEMEDDKLALVHGIAKTYVADYHNAPQLYMDYVLERCYDFLKLHPSETIIFMFKNDSNKDCETCFNTLYYNHIKGNEGKWYLKAKVPTLKEARGKLVLIRRCKMDSENEEFTQENTGIDFSNWVEQDEAIPDAIPLETNSIDNAVFLIQDRFKYKPNERWSECIEPFLNARESFNGEYIVCYFSTAGGQKGPRENAKIINSKFMEYPIDKKKYYGTIYLDFPFNELLEKIINHNFCEETEE